MLDVVQISYNEETAEENFQILLTQAPHAKRVIGVKGIFEAHKAAAEIAETSHFYVVDADAIMEEDFQFKFRPDARKMVYGSTPETDCVYCWRSRNPVNDLVYGYGALKMFPRKLMLGAKKWNVDMTTTLGVPFVPKFQISNITAFNTNPFETWKSAFRECTKLSSSIIPNGDNYDNEYRLGIWCSRGEERPFGEYCVMGANQGREFGQHYRMNDKILKLINDFDWLHEQFNKTVDNDDDREDID